MVLETILVTRHGFRSQWSVDPVGAYTAAVPSPTGIAADPALTAHGVEQARELATRLLAEEPPIEAVYSSPFYRCLQTISPYVERRRQQQHGSAMPKTTPMIRAEHGLREWFGSAPFEHPQPAPASTLQSMFPTLDPSYESAEAPSPRGETLDELEQRVARALQAMVARCDADGTRSLVLCTHAAVVIVLGRVLTGAFPASAEVDDFQAYTCGLSVYRRQRMRPKDQGQDEEKREPTWHSSYPVVGDWICELNSDCSFLRCGAERGWKFSGDESFPDTGSLSQDAKETKL